MRACVCLSFWEIYHNYYIAYIRCILLDVFVAVGTLRCRSIIEKRTCCTEGTTPVPCLSLSLS